jgi:hypothetical protein
MTSDLAVGGRFEVSRVFARTFEAIGANFGTFLALGLALCVAPQATASILADALKLGYPAEQNLISIPANLIGVVLTGALIWASLAHFAGRPVDLGKCFAEGFANFGGLFGVSFITGLGTAAGLILLLIPGLIWMTGWAVAGPAKIADRTDASSAISRSWRLTRGHRWPIFGLILIVFVGFIVAVIVLGALLGLAQPLLPKGLTTDQVDNVVLTPVLLMFFQTFLAVGATAIYWELPSTKTGGSADSTAAIFD